MGTSRRWTDPQGKPGRQGGPRGGARQGDGPSAADVAAYLKAHPDFLVEHAKLVAVLTPPIHRRGDNMVDMQHFMLQRLRDEVTRLKTQQKALISTSRHNLSSQQRIHATVLRLIGAPSFEQLLQIVTVDLAVLLDVDVVTLCIESGSGLKPPMTGIQLLPPGEVDRLIGAGRDAMLEDHVKGDPALFGGGARAGQVKALLRSSAVDKAPPGLLMALGSRRTGQVQARSWHRAAEFPRRCAGDHHFAMAGSLATHLRLPEPIPLARYAAAPDLVEAITAWMSHLGSERRASPPLRCAAYGSDFAIFLDFVRDHVRRPARHRDPGEGDAARSAPPFLRPGAGHCRPRPRPPQARTLSVVICGFYRFPRSRRGYAKNDAITVLRGPRLPRSVPKPLTVTDAAATAGCGRIRRGGSPGSAARDCFPRS